MRSLPWPQPSATQLARSTTSSTPPRCPRAVRKAGGRGRPPGGLSAWRSASAAWREDASSGTTPSRWTAGSRRSSRRSSRLHRWRGCRYTAARLARPAPRAAATSRRSRTSRPSSRSATSSTAAPTSRRQPRGSVSSACWTLRGGRATPPESGWCFSRRALPTRRGRRSRAPRPRASSAAAPRSRRPVQVRTSSCARLSSAAST
mmetsp:Transcript_28026/g.93181  ORF Transcript_28026/g.93181 Transcript_28026/m.93181 type:complete len:204 (+) Transcript_28026:178-789(+)